MTTDGLARRTTAHVAKRMVALAVIACFAPFVGACSMAGSSAQSPLYLANEGSYPFNVDETSKSLENSVGTSQSATPTSQTSGWGAYSGAQGQTAPPAPVNNVYRGRAS